MSSEKYTEEELREIKLEAIVYTLYEITIEQQRIVPIHTRKAQFLDEVATQLFNLAEVRKDIDKYAKFNIEKN